MSLGPNAQAMALGLRFEQDTPLGKIGTFLGQWYGISITSSGLSQMFDRLRRRSAPSYEELVNVARASEVVGLDESGHREDGVPGWAWLMRTDRVSVFRVEMSRGGWVAESMVGANVDDLQDPEKLRRSPRRGSELSASGAPETS